MLGSKVEMHCFGLLCAETSDKIKESTYTMAKIVESGCKVSFCIFGIWSSNHDDNGFGMFPIYVYFALL